MLNSSVVQEGLKKSGDWKYETSAVRKSGIKFGGTKYMSFHIVADSCCELTADMKKRGNIGIDFALCLLFTFLGNLSLGIGINTLVSLFNVYLGLYLVKN